MAGRWRTGSVAGVRCAWRPFVQAGTLLTHLLGRMGLHGNTDLEELGRAYALLAHREARSALVHTLRAVVDHQGQRVSALDRMHVTKRFPSLIIWGERDRVVPVSHGPAGASPDPAYLPGGLQARGSLPSPR
jgi:pimeloyl-ACP methyl ester carboxylesterase